MSDADIEKAIFAEYPDLAPKAGVFDRIKSALTPSADRAPMPSTSETINAPSGEFDTGATEATEGAISMPGSVMDGYVPQENSRGVSADSGMGPMRQSYYDETRAGLLSAPVQAHAAAAQSGGQVGKVAADSLPGRIDRAERELAGDPRAATQQEFIDDAGMGRVNRMDDGLAKLSDESAKWAVEFSKENPRSAELLGGVMRTGGGIWGAASAFLPEGTIPAQVADVSAQFADKLATDLQKQDFTATDDKLGWMLSQTLANAPSAAMSIMGMLNPASAPLVIGSLSASSGGGQYRKLIREGVDRDVATAAGVAYGLAEGIFERMELGIGSALIGRLRAVPIDVMASAGRRIMQGAAKGAGITAVAGAGEAGEEILTEISQIGADVATGKAHAARHGDSKLTAEMTDLNPLKVSNKLINAGMGGLAAGGALSTPQIAIGAAEGYKAGDLTTGRDFNQDAIDAAARQALNPDNAQLYRNGGLLSTPIAPRATPADVANAETPEAAAAAIADMGAGIAPPATDAITSAQADIDAILSEPILDIAQAPIPPSAQAMPEDWASLNPLPPAAEIPAVQVSEAIALAATDFISQDANGRWALSRPIANQPPEVVAAIIAELDRLNAGTPLQADSPAAAVPQVPQAAPETGAVQGQLTPEEKPARSGKKAFESSVKYSVDTEDGGIFDATVHRTKEGAVVIQHSDGLIEHNAEFAKGKTDEDLLKYSFEPIGYNSATPPAAEVGAGGSAIVTPQSDNQQPADTKADDDLAAALGDFGDIIGATAAAQPAAPMQSIERIKGGKLRISGYQQDDVSGSLPKEIAPLVTIKADGNALTVTMKDGSKMPIRTENAIKKALTGAGSTKAPKPRQYTGNLRNDVNLIAPGPLRGSGARRRW